MSSIDATIAPLRPTYPSNPSAGEAQESTRNQSLIRALNLQQHIEGGYFVELDRDPLTIPNPFPFDAEKKTADKPFSGDDSVRNASTSIFYFLSAQRPQGCFHRNKGRTVHTLIQGRGRYVLIHDDEEGEKKRVESFVVGMDAEKGEKMVWVVEGGKYKASYLVEGEGLLISETVVPGFEFSDHDFLPKEKFERLVTAEQAKELEWLVRDA